jgi:hypothetical protein
MNTFRFAPVLFEHRAEAQDILSRAGFEWLQHYSSIDLNHETFGLEVRGIHEKSDAIKIVELLIATFPKWPYREVVLRDRGTADQGWIVRVHKDPESPHSF